MAGDLRFITAALKISNDLERVGDHAVNIAGGTVSGSRRRRMLKPLVDIPRMAELASGMLRTTRSTPSCAATPRAARRLVRRDDEVDQLNRPGVPRADLAT